MTSSFLLHLAKMKICFWTVGKSHESHVKEGIEMFTKRISHYFPIEWKIFPPAKNAAGNSEEMIKKMEASLILNACNKDIVLIALDERGKQWDSIEFANFIQQKANMGTKELIFLIGGAYGLHESVLKRADHKWSLSKLVFPHQLVRLILAEQTYRACSILRNEKYHHQ